MYNTSLFTSDRTSSPRRAPRSGFTLIELLTVIGIIVILIGILIPVVSAVRKRGYQASSSGLISRIAAACQAYFADFKAYPGPVGDNQLSPPVNGATATITGITGNVTSSENCVLGLLGALVNTSTSTTTPTISYQPAQILNRRGPQSLNPAAPKQYPAYIDVSPDELTPYDPSKQQYVTYNSIATSTIVENPTKNTYPKPTVPDSNVPEFQDRFPTPHPIIYLRARVGAPNMIPNVPSNASPPATPSNSQYYPDQMKPYWVGKTSGSLFPTIPDPDTSTGGVTNPSLYMTAQDFFRHPTINDGTSSATNNGHTPRGNDAFILISAGADGIYGTKDDIIYSN